MQLSQPTLEPHSLCYTCCVQVVLYYTGKVFGALRPYLLPYRDERQMNLSYMVLLDMWNMFGQKFLSFIGG